VPDVHMRRLPNILVLLLCLMIVKECSENCKKLVRKLQRLSVLNLTNILQFAHGKHDRTKRRGRFIVPIADLSAPYEKRDRTKRRGRFIVPIADFEL
jgi:hypothetical protein